MSDTQDNREVGFTTDNEGRPSMMRLMNMMSMIAACVLSGFLMDAILSGQSGEGLMVGFYLVTIFLLTATAPKVLQKIVETQFFSFFDRPSQN